MPSGGKIFLLVLLIRNDLALSLTSTFKWIDKKNQFVYKFMDMNIPVVILVI